MEVKLISTYSPVNNLSEFSLDLVYCHFHSFVQKIEEIFFFFLSLNDSIEWM